MTDIYARRIGPEPSVSRAGLAVNAAALGLAIWQFVWPNPFTGAACIAAPWVAVSIAWFDQRFSSSVSNPGSTVDIGGLWAPVLVLALQGVLRQKTMEPLQPLLAALPLATILFVALVKADFEARTAFHMLGTLSLCVAWAWGTVIYANITFDPTPPVMMSGAVVKTYYSRWGTKMTVASSHAGQKMLVSALPAGDRKVGSLVLLKMKGGRFGWRYLTVLETGPSQ